MPAYYNENDRFAAQWLRNLITRGLIAPGEVDERSIEDVCPNDLAGFTQCHFFAGIGVWSYALRQAGWADDKPVWTGSCPCQSFSTAGKGKGFADERHLWPAFFHLIEQCRPSIVFGEQVEAAVKHGWLDLVQDDLEGVGYSFGAVGAPAAGVGAPHIRSRLFWVADSEHDGSHWGTITGISSKGKEERGMQQFEGRGPVGWLADSADERFDRRRASEAVSREKQPERFCDADRLVHSNNHGCGSRSEASEAAGHGGASDATNWTSGFWADADWLPCKDGKWRPIEPGSFPLAHGAAARVGRLRGYGNAVVAPLATEFIKACKPD